VCKRVIDAPGFPARGMVRPDRRGGMRGAIRAGTLFGQAEFLVRRARAGELVDEPIKDLLEALDVLDRKLEDGDHALVITVLARTALDALAAGDVGAAPIALDIDRARPRRCGLTAAPALSARSRGRCRSASCRPRRRRCS
jgi:hypothetical protein